MVEDDGDLCETLREFLCDREAGNECHFAKTMKEARELMRKHRFNVILLDLMIGGEQSAPLVDEARALYGANNVVIILMSAMIGAKAVSDKKECEFFMGKPFDLETIDEIIFTKCKKRFDHLTQVR